MAKMKGKVRWGRREAWFELMALEIRLDSLHQKALRNDLPVTLYEEEISKMVGAVRSVLAKMGHKQKTLKRWVTPAPNQRI